MAYSCVHACLISHIAARVFSERSADRCCHDSGVHVSFQRPVKWTLLLTVTVQLVSRKRIKKVSRGTTKVRFMVPVNGWRALGQPRVALTVDGVLLSQREACVVILFGYGEAERGPPRGGGGWHFTQRCTSQHLLGHFSLLRRFTWRWRFPCFSVKSCVKGSHRGSCWHIKSPLWCWYLNTSWMNYVDLWRLRKPSMLHFVEAL